MVDTMRRLVRPSAERRPPELSKQARIWVVLLNQFLGMLYARARRAARTARRRNSSMTGNVCADVAGSPCNAVGVR